MLFLVVLSFHPSQPSVHDACVPHGRAHVDPLLISLHDVLPCWVPPHCCIKVLARVMSLISAHARKRVPNSVEAIENQSTRSLVTSETPSTPPMFPPSPVLAFALCLLRLMHD